MDFTFSPQHSFRTLKFCSLSPSDRARNIPKPCLFLPEPVLDKSQPIGRYRCLPIPDCNVTLPSSKNEVQHTMTRSSNLVNCIHRGRYHEDCPADSIHDLKTRDGKKDIRYEIYGVSGREREQASTIKDNTTTRTKAHFVHAAYFSSITISRSFRLLLLHHSVLHRIPQPPQCAQSKNGTDRPQTKSCPNDQRRSAPQALSTVQS